MISKTTHLFIFFFTLVYIGYSQAPKTPSGGGEYVFNPNKTPCLTTDEKNNIKELLQNNVKILESQNKLSYSKNVSTVNPLFIWPVKKSSSNPYNDVWSISNYVDHNAAAPNQLTDYNCGSKTYDTNSGYNHQGLDIYTWPFTWKLLDDDALEIVAASSGQIIAKNDGEFDRSCDFNSNTWNAVYVQHSDGSVAWYGHMKNGSTTSKSIGDMVAQGEYLGIVGSSGNSTGPHLHFEVWEDNTYTKLIDPYSGPCNNMNSESWWANQKPYTNPKINALLTHSQVPNIFPGCPTTETPNTSDDFITSDNIIFAVYVRDQTVNDNISLEIIRPDNSSVFNNWNVTVQTTASSWYYYWNLNGYFDMVGEWKWRATFGGETITHTFNVTSALSVKDNVLKDTSIYPNPSNNLVHIASKVKIVNAEIVSITGKSIKTLNANSIGIKLIDISSLSKGLYFLNLKGSLNEQKTIKLIKN